MTDQKELTEVEKQHQLIKRVFSSEDGKKLLDVLAEEYVWTPQMHPDPNVLYSRIGVQGLITHFISITKGK